MARLPYPDPEQLPPHVRQILVARPPRNVFRMLSHATAVMPGVMELTGAILYKSALEPALRELLILRVGHLCGSSYEVHQHRKIAAAVGLPQDKIDAASRDADGTLYDSRELLVLRLAEQVVRKVKADAALFAAVSAEFGNAQTVELIVIIGTYVMLAQVLENAEVEVEDGDGPAQDDVSKLFSHQVQPT